MKSEDEIKAEIAKLRSEAELNAHGAKFNAPLALILEARKRGLEWVLGLSTEPVEPSTDIKEEGGQAVVGEFHTHLDGCAQCKNHPFDLCGEGLRILLTELGGGLMPLQDLGALPSRERLDAIVESLHPGKE